MKGLNTLIRSVDSQSAKAKFPFLGAHCISANCSRVRHPLFCRRSYMECRWGGSGELRQDFAHMIAVQAENGEEKTIPQLLSLVLQEESKRRAGPDPCLQL